MFDIVPLPLQLVWVVYGICIRNNHSLSKGITVKYIHLRLDFFSFKEESVFMELCTVFNNNHKCIVWLKGSAVSTHPANLKEKNTSKDCIKNFVRKEQGQSHSRTTQLNAKQLFCKWKLGYTYYCKHRKLGTNYTMASWEGEIENRSEKSMENMPGIKLKTELALLFPLQLANDITILKNRYFSERWKKLPFF